jgi:GPH family glycoside/pentoside/hexuronide:cation symporter
MEPKKTTTLPEKIAYSLGDAGTNIIQTFLGTFLALYYTDNLLLSGAFVGTMTLIMRFLDGISDIGMGMVIERTATRFGKARPWFGASILPLGLCFVVAFNTPLSLSTTGRMAFVVLMYFLLNVVMITANSVSYHAMFPRISLDVGDRNRISAIRSGLSFVVGLTLAIVSAGLLAAFGGEREQGAWTKMSLLFVGCFAVLQIIAFTGSKEKLPATREGNATVARGIIKEGVKSLLHTRYFYLLAILFILNNLGSGAFMGIAMYFARDVLGDSGYYMLLAIAYVIPTLIGIILMPALLKRFGKRNMLLLGAGLSVAISVVGLLAPSNLIAVLVTIAVRSLGSAPFVVALFTLSPDLVDYLAARTGRRLEGLTTSTMSFGIKVGNGLGIATLGWSLAIGGYSGSAVTQTASALSAEAFLLIAVPMITAGLSGVAIWFWDMESKAGPDKAARDEAGTE